jgi:hypothetical protein
MSRALALFASIGLLVVPVAARAQRERHAPILLQLPVTARTMAMGGADGGFA